jgi:hypothetical protein
MSTKYDDLSDISDSESPRKRSVSFGEITKHIIEKQFDEQNIESQLSFPSERNNVEVALVSNPRTHSKFGAHVKGVIHQHCVALDNGLFTDKDNYGCHKLFSYIEKQYNKKIDFITSDCNKRINDNINDLFVSLQTLYSDEKKSLKRKYTSQFIEQEQVYDAQLSLQLNIQKLSYDEQLNKQKQAYDEQLNKQKQAYDEQLNEQKQAYDEQLNIQKQAYDEQLLKHVKQFEVYKKKQKIIVNDRVKLHRNKLKSKLTKYILDA